MRKSAIGAALLGAAFVSALATGTAQANPDAIVKALQEKPATLLDVSIARLDAMLGSTAAVEGYDAHGFYQEGRIRIYAYSYDIEPTEANCKKIADGIKRAGGVVSATGWADNPASAYASMFNYPQLDEVSIDETYMQTVDSMFDIMVVLGVTGDGKGMVCQTKLLSKETTYSME